MTRRGRSNVIAYPEGANRSPGAASYCDSLTLSIVAHLKSLVTPAVTRVAVRRPLFARAARSDAIEDVRMLAVELASY